MSNVIRVNGEKHNLSRYNPSELQTLRDRFAQEMVALEMGIMAIANEERSRTQDQLPMDDAGFDSTKIVQPANSDRFRVDI